ncbi:hypothetical protein JKG47_21345 [Acidithiobacillus sp. MC6.1]|nr:hypothetical protein [Acidithiobacillus sp. MC6.1]
MKWRLYSGDWESTKKANVVLLAAVALLTVGNIFLASDILSTDTRVVLVPPHLSHEARIGYGSANVSYYKAWGMYVAEMVGNLTPANTKFVVDSLVPLMGPGTFQAVKTALYAEKDQEVEYHVTTAFDATSIIWQPITSTIFVTGDLHQISPTGRYTAGGVQTYEMKIRIRQGQPVITNFQDYPGIPHTLTWIEHQHPKKKAVPASGQ